MEGIEILNSVEIMKVPTWSIILLILGLIFTFVFWMLAEIVNHSVISDFFAGLCLISLLSFIAGIACAIWVEIPTGRYKYQVTINESVSLTDFYENYEVIEQNGKIWTIKEKN